MRLPSHSFPVFIGGMVLMGIANCSGAVGSLCGCRSESPRTSRARDLERRHWWNGWLGHRSVRGRASGFGLVGSWGIDELAGAYLVALILFAIAAVVVFFGLRPDPREIGKEVAEKFPETVISFRSSKRRA
jgi:hypothetical protein